VSLDLASLLCARLLSGLDGWWLTVLAGWLVLAAWRLSYVGLFLVTVRRPLWFSPWLLKLSDRLAFYCLFWLLSLV